MPLDTSISTGLTSAAAWSFISTLITAIVIVVTKGWHGLISMDHASGIQKVHTEPTPRVGGLAILVGLLCGIWRILPSLDGELLFCLLLAGLPAMLIGLVEDLTKRVSVLHRFLATMVCGLVGWWLTGYSLTRLDIPLFDQMLTFTFMSVLFTSFAIGGVANSINIIDGFNGLAPLTSIFALLGLGLIAELVGDLGLFAAAVVLASCVLGFLVINWPFGKLFLGDGGAYFLGFSIAWIAVMLVQRNPGVSAFSALVICAHPVNEVLFSIYRRWRTSAHPGEADHMHLHSLLYSYLSSTCLISCSPLMRNSLTGCLVSSISLMTVTAALITFNSTRLSLAAYLAISVLYVLAYQRLKGPKKNET